MSGFSQRSFSLPWKRSACALAVCLAVTIAVAQVPAPNTATPVTAPLQPAVANVPLTNLTFDALTQEYHAQPGETEARFTFTVTNVSDVAVHVLTITASCSCTKAQMPRTPWIISPHTTEQFHATMQLAGKPPGDNTKYLTISSTNGVKVVYAKAHIPLPSAPSTMTDRQKNQELAKSDRQAVFRNDCAQCHVTPVMGKLGKELYDSACGICHDSEHRATMITDLGSLNHPVDAEFWRLMISNGKPATMMPAFAQSQGGPLSQEQISSLVDYLMTDFPRNHKPTQQVQVPQAASATQTPSAASRPVPLTPPRFVPPAQKPATDPPATQPGKN
jgi:mono/diheme cytochrome c family protein